LKRVVNVTGDTTVIDSDSAKWLGKYDVGAGYGLGISKGAGEHWAGCSCAWINVLFILIYP
jgi:hypothetical protein